MVILPGMMAIHLPFQMFFQFFDRWYRYYWKEENNYCGEKSDNYQILEEILDEIEKENNYSFDEYGKSKKFEICYFLFQYFDQNFCYQSPFYHPLGKALFYCGSMYSHPAGIITKVEEINKLKELIESYNNKNSNVPIILIPNFGSNQNHNNYYNSSPVLSNKKKTLHKVLPPLIPFIYTA